MPNTRFENIHRVFHSMDDHFEQVDYFIHDRSALKVNGVEIPGSHPLYFLPTEDGRELVIRFLYVGENYRSDIDSFAQKLYNQRLPHRIILEEEDDRYYVGLILSLPSMGEHESIGRVEASVQLLRNYALRRWTDHEVRPENTEIDFGMPIVPVQTEWKLTGSSILIPYYNEGTDVPPVLEVTGVDYITVFFDGKEARYDGKVQEKLLLDFETMTAKDGQTVVDDRFIGDQILIPHGEHHLRLLYQPRLSKVVSVSHDTLGQFSKGTTNNVEITQDAVRSKERLTPVYIANNSEVPSYPKEGYNEFDGTPAFYTDDAGNHVYLPRLTFGKWGKAVVVEDQITQQLKDSLFTVLTDDNGVELPTSLWKLQGAAVVGQLGVCNIIESDPSLHPSGSGPIQAMQTFPQTSGNFNAGALIRKTGEVDYLSMRLVFRDSTKILASKEEVIVDKSKGIDPLDSEWGRYWIHAVAPAGTEQVEFYPLYDGGIVRENLAVEVTMPTVSKSDFPRIWLPAGGTIPSNRRAEDDLYIPLTGANEDLLNPSAGEIAMWFYEDAFQRVNNTCYLFDTNGKMENRFSLVKMDDATFTLRVNNTEVIQGIRNPGKGWRLVQVQWENDTFQVLMDGVLATKTDDTEAKVTEVIPNFTGLTELRIGQEYTNEECWNMPIDSLRISNRSRFQEHPVTSESIRNLLENPLLVDEHVVYFTDFNDFSPVDRNFRVESAGVYTSSSISIGTGRPDVSIKKGTLSVVQRGGSVPVETSLNTGSGFGPWVPVGANGSIHGIGPDVDLSNAQLRYRGFFHTRDVKDPQELRTVNIDLITQSQTEAKVVIKNRKRLV